MAKEITFDDWLRDALTDGGLDLYVDDKAEVNRFAVRFNNDIAQIITAHGEERTNKAVWHIYGSASGYMWDVLDPSLGADRLRFMESVKWLYANGFQRYCADHFGHIDSGVESPRPLNSSCYMLWDMDGIECPAVNGEEEMLEASLDVLAFALRLDHAACQESALHGLGHLSHSDRTKTTPIIRDFIRRTDPRGALKTYAENAIVGCVL